MPTLSLPFGHTMERMNESNETEDSISILPEVCLSEILSYTSPRDASRAAAISKEFNAAADSDSVWERFLPPDIYNIISRSVSPVVFGSRKQLYVFLSEAYIILDRGNLSFKLDKETGKKCYMLGARDLSILEFHNHYWDWIELPESRFQEVAAVLEKVCWIEIRGKIAVAMLSKKSLYVVYLVYRFTWDSWGFSSSANTMVSFCGIESVTSNVYLQKPVNRDELWSVYIKGLPHFPQMREDGWMEMVLGEFYCDVDDGGEVEMVYNDKYGNYKIGLIVEGIELRPK